MYESTFRGVLTQHGIAVVDVDQYPTRGGQAAEEPEAAFGPTDRPMRHVFGAARRSAQRDQLIARPKRAVEKHRVCAGSGLDNFRRGCACSRNVRQALAAALVLNQKA